MAGPKLPPGATLVTSSDSGEMPLPAGATLVDGAQHDAPPASSGPLDKLRDAGEAAYPYIPPFEAKPTTMGARVADYILRPAANVGGSIVKNLMAMPAGLVDAVTHAPWTPGQSVAQMNEDARGGTRFDPSHPPAITPAAVDEYATDVLGGAGAGLLSGEVAKLPFKVPGAAKRLLTGDVNKPIPGTDMTPATRYEAAKRLGVQLPAAQATGSTPLKAADWLARGSLFGEPAYDALDARNTTALHGAVDRLTEKMSPLSNEEGGRLLQGQIQAPFRELQGRAHTLLNDASPLNKEQGGARLQNMLTERQGEMHDVAHNLYGGVADAWGDQPVVKPGLVSNEAYTMLREGGRTRDQFPSLSSRRINSVLTDASRLGGETQRETMGAPTVGDLINSRSKLLDLSRDPEIVKSSDGAKVQRLIKAHDDAIMDSLPPEGQNDWRAANETWEKMKNTFDSPQSPYYHAVRTPSPSTLTGGIGAPTPENVRTLFGHTGEEGQGIVRRGEMESLLGRTPTGEYNLGQFSNDLERRPEAYRDELFGGHPDPDGPLVDQFHQPLRDLASDYRAVKPLESAAFKTDPAKLTEGVGPQTVGGLNELGRAGVDEEGKGVIQKGTANRLLSTDATGARNFKTFGRQYNLMDPEYRSALFAEHEPDMSDLAQTSNAMDTNYNRSGSGKLIQKVGEAGSLMTPLPYALGAGAKLMTSPSVVDWMMRPRGPLPEFVRKIPALTAAGGGAVAAYRDRGDLHHLLP